MLAVVAPGQGAQTPGFLAPWLDVPAAAAALERAQAVSGLDLVRLGTEGSADEIRDTAVAQPLLVAAALASAAAVGLPAVTSGPVVFAGHSIGELPAAVLAGAFGSDDAMLLARERGTAMAAACAVAETGMIAVLGGDPAEVDEALAAAGLVAANRNGAGQVVAAGPRDGLERLTANPPGKARLRVLEVAGAFHTEAMRPAQTALAGVAAGVAFADPSAPLLSNADGALVTDAEDLRRRLVTQVAAPVLWDECMARMAELGVTAMLELAPGGTLTGLAKRALRGVETVALRTPDDLPAAVELLATAGAGAAR